MGYGPGKIAHGAGKVGMLIEGLGYIVAAARALAKTARSDPDKSEGSRTDSPRSGLQ
jgi:hypothetical protein